jgi:hypothetical protein
MMKLLKLFHTKVYVREKKIAHKVILGCSMIAIICSAFPLLARSADTGLCTSEEKVIFSCTIGKKTLSVCASKDLSSNSGYLQYRFGTSLDKLELVFPQTKDHPRSHFRLATDHGPKSYSLQLSFFVGQTEYIVFDEYERFVVSDEGVLVLNSGKVSACLECSDGSEHGPLLSELEEIGIPAIKLRNIYSKCKRAGGILY